MSIQARARKNRSSKNWALFVLLSFITLLVNLPVLNMVMNSFHTTDEILRTGGAWFATFSISNYGFVLAKTAFFTWFANSLLVSISAVLISVSLAALAGYALSRFSGWGITAYSRILLIKQMFPLILALIPLFILFRNINLIDSPLSAILIYSAVNLAFATWMFKAFFDSIPKELEEAAYVDGCTRIQALVKVVVPLVGPGTVAVSIFSFLFAFNEYLIANVFLRGIERMTLPVGLQTFTQQFGSDWGSMMAGSVLTMIPTIVLFLFVQKYLLYGSVASGVKG
jgi:ABC-type glycerol-3-phosphate transport system permease component